jgi:hypothetical protein
MSVDNQNLSGYVTFFLVDRKKGTYEYMGAHNDIQVEALSIALLTLTGLSPKINQIAITSSGVTTEKLIYQVQYPSPRKVSFFAFFGEDEVVGTIEALALKHTPIGNFSWFNTLEVEKPSGIELLVRWTIEIDSCEGLPPEPTFGNGFLYQDDSGFLLQDGSGLSLNLPE